MIKNFNIQNNKHAQRGISTCWNILQRIVIIFGYISLILVILCFTDYPFWTYYWMGTHQTEIHQDPDAIIVLGGDGMPSGSGLMRTFYSSKLANDFPGTRLFIALPHHSDDITQSDAWKMKKEIMLRGIDSTRIRLETNGHNTRKQAMNIAGMLTPGYDSVFIVLVTSPEHMYRAIKTYKKAGFENIGGYSSFSSDLDPRSLRDKSLKEKERSFTCETETSLDLRYNLWTQLKYEILIIREWFAIGYYKLKGWI